MVQNKNAPGFPGPSGSLGCSFFPEEPWRNSASRLPATWSPRWFPALRRLSSSQRGAGPRHRRGGSYKTANGTGLKPHRRRGLAGRPAPPPRNTCRWGRTRPRQPWRRTGSDKGPAPTFGASADGPGPGLRPPGGLASIPPQPLTWPAARTHRPEPCP